MPALEMAQELLSWPKQEGDRVVNGEPLLEIETDKAVVEVESPADGILAGIKAEAGADIPVGQTIAWIAAPGERLGSYTKTEGSQPAAALAGREQTPSNAKIYPKARRLAKELGVDLAIARSSGPGGEILASDVQVAASAPRRGRAEIWKHRSPHLARPHHRRTHTQSGTAIPHFFVSREVEAPALNEYRERMADEIERSHQFRATHTEVLVELAARVLLKHPRLNASWSAAGIRLHDRLNMSIAIAVNDGVVAPIIPNAHTARLLEIAMQRHDVAERARGGKLRPADISGASFTISNLGIYQVDQFSAIITPPQAAILALGGIADRVVAGQGQPAVRARIMLTVSCDHRAADGALAALFLSDLAEAIRNPEKTLQQGSIPLGAKLSVPWSYDRGYLCFPRSSL